VPTLLSSDAGEISIEFKVDTSVHISGTVNTIFYIGGSGTDSLSFFKDSNNDYVVQVVKEGQLIGPFFNADSYHYLTLGSDLEDGWYQAVINWDDSTTYGYLNGVEQGSLAYKADLLDGYQLTVGANSDKSNTFNGLIRNLQLCLTPRTAATILSNYTAGTSLANLSCEAAFDGDLFAGYLPSGTYTCEQIDIGQIITANITAYFISNFLLSSGTSATLQYRTSQDGSTFTDWQDFTSVQATFRYLDFRAVLATTDTTKTPEVNHFTISVDVPDTDLSLTAAIAAGGSTVKYGQTFYAVPVVTPTAVGEDLYAQVISKTTSSVTIKVKDSSSNDIGGTVDLRIKGY